MSDLISPFHMAFPVTNLARTRPFYEDLLGCKVGRTDERWIDFNFFGHQLTAHLVDEPLGKEPTNEVDGKKVPVRHFGAILPWEEWNALAERLQNEKISFVIAPYIRFEGKLGEQATMFFTDPDGHALEFKSFKDPARIFATS